MPLADFESLAAQVKPLAGVMSLHVTGEPMTHPQFKEIVSGCSRMGIELNLVTNGTLAGKYRDLLLSEKSMGQISFSLHALQYAGEDMRSRTLAALAEIAKAKREDMIIAFRLRGQRGTEFEKGVSAFLRESFGGGEKLKNGATKLADRVFLHHGDFFGWPGENAGGGHKGCLGLKHHFAVLCGGDVVPCCMDYDGNMALGNVKTAPLKDILGGTNAAAMRRAVAEGEPSYCKSCGFSSP
jgi:radical SAM protein with 4Fe4S-binding SPASM domain